MCLILQLILAFVLLSFPAAGAAEVRTLYQSVEQALNTNPQLQILAHNSEAVQYDLKQARGGYLPVVDMLLGYGLDQHSDDGTRQPGADPNESDWDPRGDASLRLTQPLYDGGETGSQVSIQKELLDSANYQLQAAAQTIAFEAVSVHLNVFRQRKLVSLSEKNVKIHLDIHRSLEAREQAGVSTIADVTQTQSRLARAESTLYLSQADLSQAIANYIRVVGVPPGELAYADKPETLPQTLKEALQRTGQANPELLALKSERSAAEARVALARSNLKPKIDVELSSRYNDGLEGDPSWQNTNAAMLYLRWDLYRGGRNKAGSKAALSRKRQAYSKYTAKRVELTEATSSAWANYLSLQRQKDAYRDAVAYSRKTFDAYVIQFGISRRSLMEVLIAENEFFQSALQLVTVGINESIAAYRILALMGALQVSASSGAADYPREYDDLTQALELPFDPQLLTTNPQNASSDIPPSPVQNPLTEQDAVGSGQTPEATIMETAGDDTSSTPLYGIDIGPCINQRELDLVTEALRHHGLSAEPTTGTGRVKMVRLLEGIYPSDEAQGRLAVLKKSVDSAFLLPAGEKIGLYLASFHDPQRALRYAELLGQDRIEVAMVECEIEMPGNMLSVRDIDRQTAEAIADQMSGSGLTAEIISLDPDSSR